MSSMFELIGAVFYILVIVIVLIILMVRCNAENRKVLVSVVSLFALIIINVFFYIPLLQFVLFILVIINIYHLIFVYILPYFYTQNDRLLFTEITKEIWEDIKVNDTIIEDKKK